MLKHMVSTFEGATPHLTACVAANDGTPRALGNADDAGPDEPQGGRAREDHPVTAWNRVAARERQLDHYRQAVERYLGAWPTGVPGGDFERFFEHVERCFDWGVSAPACARTWVVKALDQTSRCR